MIEAHHNTASRARCTCRVQFALQLASSARPPSLALNICERQFSRRVRLRGKPSAPHLRPGWLRAVSSSFAASGAPCRLTCVAWAQCIRSEEPPAQCTLRPFCSWTQLACLLTLHCLVSTTFVSACECPPVSSSVALQVVQHTYLPLHGCIPNPSALQVPASTVTQ